MGAPPPEALRALARAKVFGFDFETKPRPGQPDNKAVRTDPRRCQVEWISVATAAGAWDWPVEDGEDWRGPLLPFLDDESKTIVIHNGQFEHGVFRHTYDGYVPKATLWDSMVSSFMVDENLTDAFYCKANRKRYGIGLKARAPEELGMEEMLTYKEAFDCRSSVFPEIREKWRKYCRDDSVGALGLRNRHKTILEREGTKKVFEDLEMETTEILSEMEAIGIPMDAKVLRKYRDQFSLERDKARQETADAFGVHRDFKFGSNKELSWLLYDKLRLHEAAGLELGGFEIALGKDGPSTNKLALTAMKVRDAHPGLVPLMKWRAHAHHVSSFWEPNLKRVLVNDGFVYPQISQVSQVTWRLSFKEPCITAFPRGSTAPVREAVVARPGFTIIAMDLSQAELRMLAHMSRDPTLLAVYNDNYMNGDYHTITAQATGADRDTAKNINFGCMYLMGPGTLCRQLLEKHEIIMDAKDAAVFIAKYFQECWGVKLYHNTIERWMRDDGYVTDIIKRRRHLKWQMGRDFRSAHRQGVNFRIQASVGSLVKIAMKRIRRRLLSMDYWGPDKAHFLFYVHDELDVECPDEIVPEVRQVMKEELESVAKLVVPLKADSGVGKSWAEAK